MLTLYIILLLLIAYFCVISLCDDDTLLFYIIEVLFIVGMLRIRTLMRSYFVDKNKKV